MTTHHPVSYRRESSSPFVHVVRTVLCVLLTGVGACSQLSTDPTVAPRSEVAKRAPAPIDTAKAVHPHADIVDPVFGRPAARLVGLRP